MSEEAEEKHHKPSVRRMEQLKKKGTFLRSRDLSSGTVLLIAIALIMVMANQFYKVLSNNFILSFTSFDRFDSLSGSFSDLYKKTAVSSFTLLLPLCCTLFICIFFFAFLFGGWGISWDLVKFKIERIDPLKNLKKIVSFSNLFEIIKSVFKFSLLFSLLAIFIYGKSDDLLHLDSVGNKSLLIKGILLVKTYLMYIIAGVIAIIVVDMLYSYFSYQKKIKMSHQEMKDEHKETDGNPENKRRLRQAQRALSQQRLQYDVPKASVIITNPTHYSVALRYDDKVDKAPKIVALGVDFLAAEIRMIAIKNAIPIYEAPELARAIYYTGKVGDTIHPDLYMAVAIVLSYIAQLKNYQIGLGEMPAYVQDLQIPKEFHYDVK